MVLGVKGMVQRILDLSPASAAGNLPAVCPVASLKSFYSQPYFFSIQRTRPVEMTMAPTTISVP